MNVELTALLWKVAVFTLRAHGDKDLAMKEDSSYYAHPVSTTRHLKQHFPS